MQRTRLNLLFDDLWRRFTGFFQNPWRRLTLIALALLSGNFIATVFPPAIGQTTTWDPVVAFFIMVITEAISVICYRQGDRQSSPTPTDRKILFDLMNAMKIGLLYGLTVSAINVGS
ncbi:hypothetical protein NIES970_01820 [[Synechococcus] sp. NIES-970]|nr:hypothetical protein NIES970_01820 [[Synechococcus] sp. NIES-970]